MQRLEEETLKPSPVGEIVRYVVVLGLAGFIIYYYYFRMPINYVDKQTVGETMATHFAVKVHGFPDNKDWDEVAHAIRQTLDSVDRAMSTYKKDSEVSRFNASDSTDWFDVSKETAEVVQLSLEISQLTGGAFDITVGPLVGLWGFGAGRERIGLEAIKSRIEETQNRVGYEKLEVRLDPPALKKSIPNLSIDLSAIAKGYAVDQVAGVLNVHRINNYMIEVGGEVRCNGNKSEKNDWLIGIEKPIPGQQDEFPGVQRTIRLGNRSLATSGNARSYHEIDGFLLSHVIDPRTGFPTEYISPNGEVPLERLGSVSVIDSTCARADALATAMFVLGEKDGLALAEKEGIAVLFLLRSAASDDKGSEIREATSTAFP